MSLFSLVPKEGGTTCNFRVVFNLFCVTFSSLTLVTVVPVSAVKGVSTGAGTETKRVPKVPSQTSLRGGRRAGYL